MSMRTNFIASQSGAITVEKMVVIGGVIGLAIATFTAIRNTTSSNTIYVTFTAIRNTTSSNTIYAMK